MQGISQNIWAIFCRHIIYFIELSPKLNCMQTVGSRIALYRNSRRWTQDRLASDLNITQSLLSEIENDKISPKWDLIAKAAEVLEVPVQELLPCSGISIMHNHYTDYSGHILNGGDIVQHHANDKETLLTELLATKDELLQALREECANLKKEVTSLRGQIDAGK